MPDAGPGGGAAGHYSAGRVRRGLWHFLLGKGFATVAGLVTAILLVRAMPVKDYAVYATLIGLQMVLIALVGLGLDRAITRYFPEARQADDTATLVRLISTFARWRLAGMVVVIGLAVAVTPWLADFFHGEGHVAGFHLMWLFTALFGLGKVSTRMLQALMQQRAVKWAIITESGLRLVLLLAWLIWTGGALALEEALVIVSVGTAASLVLLESALWLELRAMRRSGPGGCVHVDAAELARFCRHNYFQELFLLPGQPSSLRLIGAYFLAPAAMAAFGFFQTLTGSFRRNLPVQFLLDFAEPIMMAAYFKDRNFRRLNDMTGSVLKVNLFLLVPLLTWLIPQSGAVTALLTGGKYVEQAWMLPVLVLGLIYESHWIVLRTVANGVGRSELLFHAGAASVVALLLLLGMMLLVPGEQAGVLVLGGVLMLAGRNGYVVRGVRRAGHDYRLDWPGLAKLALAAGIATLAGIAVTTMVSATSMGWLVTGLVLLICYPVLVRLLRPFGEEERALLLRVHKKLGYLI